MTTSQNTQQLQMPQKRLGYWGLVTFLILMDMFIPLSTDMYLPSLPTMGQHLSGNPGEAIIKFSVTAFFISYTIGMLVWGPISDQHGRKKPLLLGFGIYALGCLGCMSAPRVEVLILFRIIQGLGAASATTISMAIVKDSFTSRMREPVLAIIQTVSCFGPIIAPVLGGWMLLFTSWRGIFLVLALGGGVGILLTALMEETLPVEQRLAGNLQASLGAISHVMKNKGFLYIVAFYGVGFIPFYMYITLSSYIYINDFGLTEQQYTYYYAGCALLSMLGPAIYIKFLTEMNKQLLLYGVMVVSIIGGAFVLLWGSKAPMLFCFGFFLFFLFTNIIRPYLTNLTLEQEEDIGTASSVMNMLYNLFGTAGMLMASIPFASMMNAIGWLVVITCGISILLLYRLVHSDIPLKNFEK